MLLFVSEPRHGAPWLPSERSRQDVFLSSRIGWHTSLRAADPEFAANVGQATDTLREDHARIPDRPPGLTVADADVLLDLAQLPALRFQGLKQYREFWDNFRTGVQLVSSSSSSEVVQVVQSGLYIRIRWRLLLTPRVVMPGGEAAAGALRAARGALGASAQQGALGGWLQAAGAGLLGEVEQWAASAAPAAQVPQERTVELNSIYEMNCWTGRIVKHTLEFRSPEEDFDLLGVLQGVPSPSFR